MINYAFKINKLNYDYRVINNFAYLFAAVRTLFNRNYNYISKFNAPEKKTTLPSIIVSINSNSYMNGKDVDFSIKLKIYNFNTLKNFNTYTSLDNYIFLLYFNIEFYFLKAFKLLINSSIFKYTKYSFKRLKECIFERKSTDLFNTRRCSVFMSNYKFIDHRRYFNIVFKDLSYNMLDSLTMFNLVRQRYGIGDKMAYQICKYLGVSNRFPTSMLPLSNHYSKLSNFFSNNLDNLDNSLMNFMLSKQLYSIQLKTYKGFRLMKGYPSNGQRTRSNHKTASRKPYKSTFYYI